MCLLYLYLLGKKIKNLYFIYRISDIHTIIYYLNSIIIIQHKITKLIMLLVYLFVLIKIRIQEYLFKSERPLS